jgi:hypothetical protein
LLPALLAGGIAAAENIDPDDANDQYAWSENWGAPVEDLTPEPLANQGSSRLMEDVPLEQGTRFRIGQRFVDDVSDGANHGRGHTRGNVSVPRTREAARGVS